MISQFANDCNVKFDEKTFNQNPHNRDEEYSFRFGNIKKHLKEFLETNNPSQEQIKQLSKIFHKLINADGKISKEEDIIIGELDGIILEYLGEPVPVYSVISVPQEEEKRRIIENILSNLYPEIDIKSLERQIDGGFGFLMHECKSLAYAELMAQQERNNHKLMTIVKKEIN